MENLNINSLKREISALADKKQAVNLSRFFKTGKGEYGEGDIFLGIKVPVQRKLAKKYSAITLKETEELLQSKIHENRMIALFILVEKYKDADKSNKESKNNSENHIHDNNEKIKKQIYDLYLNNTKYINNWDLVDLSAPKIVGEHLLSNKNNSRQILYKLAKSDSLWEKRIAIMSTFRFIYNNEYSDTLKISEILLNDSHDLIHKAVGWMLREVGKRVSNGKKIEEDFLKKHSKNMPRTMLRYAIERFPEYERQMWLKK